MPEVKEEKPILGPSSNVLEALKDASFSEPTEINKDGEKVATRLVRDGSGLLGLEDRTENQEWSGIFNHYVKTAGASLKIGRLLKLNGYDLNLQLMLDAVMLSHSGRRLYDEARRFPEEVSDPGEKMQKGDSKIGLDHLKEMNLPHELIDTVSATGHSFAAKTWEEKIPSYLDHRISQNAMTLNERFIDLQRGVEAGRYTQEFLDLLYEWDIKIEKELFGGLHIPSYETIAANPQNLKARIDLAIKLGKFSKDEVEAIKNTKLYKPKSGKDINVAGAVGLSQVDLLDRLQLHPEDINDKLLEPELWERYIRRLYINDSEQGIFVRLSKLHRDVEEGKAGSVEKLEKEFPENTWWGKYARELFDKRRGIPLHPRLHKQMGIARAIEFYRQLEENE